MLCQCIGLHVDLQTLPTTKGNPTNLTHIGHFASYSEYCPVFEAGV